MGRAAARARDDPRRFNAQLVDEHGLTLNDYEVLLRLSRAEGRRLRRVDLAERVLLTPSGITRLLEGLERKRYVERASCDVGRARDLRAADRRGATRSCARRRETHVAEIREYIGGRFSDEELEALGRLLERLPLDPARTLAATPERKSRKERT